MSILIGFVFVHAVGYLIIMFISTAYLINDTYNPFLYFKF